MVVISCISTGLYMGGGALGFSTKIILIINKHVALVVKHMNMIEAIMVALRYHYNSKTNIIAENILGYQNCMQL